MDQIRALLRRAWPGSIRAGTLVVLAVTLVLTQVIGLTFYRWDQERVERQIEGRDLRERIDIAQRVIAAAPRANLDQVVEALRSSDLIVNITPRGMPPVPPVAPVAPVAPLSPPAPATPAGPEAPNSPAPPTDEQVENHLGALFSQQQAELKRNLDAFAAHSPPGLNPDIGRQMQEQVAVAMEQAARMEKNVRRALDRARAAQERSRAVQDEIQEQIAEANENLHGYIEAARDQIREARQRMREAQQEAARTNDPEARESAMEEVRAANADVAEAQRELARLTSEVSSRVVRLQLPAHGGDDVIQVIAKPIHAPFDYTRFLLFFTVCAVLLLALGWYATRQVTAPLALFGAAAERLGRNADGPPLPEDGPDEVRQAAAAFNRMQGRVKKFISDRTTMLAAISHDLRTPITRMRLRVEFVEDETDRAKLISDLDEMEAMIAEALAFARNEAEIETVVEVDLQALAQSVTDDQRAVGADVEVEPGTPAYVLGRPSSLKRALTNLVRNAVLYGGSARLSVLPLADGFAVNVKDQGPGIPEDDLERVFTPFLRLEESRNKASGGVGLGLSVARSTARAHGGDITLANRRADGTDEIEGLTATLYLPAMPKAI